MRLPQRQRMAFITSWLDQTGAINRADLIAAFEISAQQAAIDFRIWTSLNPGQMVYNASTKRYEKAEMSEQPAKPGPTARPQIIAKADFVALAELAYRKVHTRNLAGQMAEALDMSPASGEKSCQRWLDERGPAPPPDVLQTTCERARLKWQNLGYRLDEAEKVLKEID